MKVSTGMKVLGGFAVLGAILIQALFMGGGPPVDAGPFFISRAPVTLGTTTYHAVVVKPGVTRAEITDAGIDLAKCDPAVMECQVLVHPECRDLDGGHLPAYLAIGTKVFLCANGIEKGPTLVLRWPRQKSSDCFEPAGPASEACVLTDLCHDGGTSCADDSEVIRPVQPRCACAQPDAGSCLARNPDGGKPVQAKLGMTLPAGSFSGSGCVRKVCAEIAGTQGQSWPSNCPEK